MDREKGTNEATDVTVGDITVLAGTNEQCSFHFHEILYSIVSIVLAITAIGKLERVVPALLGLLGLLRAYRRYFNTTVVLSVRISMIGG